jgi:hypothetical protein
MINDRLRRGTEALDFRVLMGCWLGDEPRVLFIYKNWLRVWIESKQTFFEKTCLETVWCSSVPDEVDG